MEEPTQTFEIKRVGYDNDYRDAAVYFRIPEGYTKSNSYDVAAQKIKHCGYICSINYNDFSVVARPTSAASSYKTWIKFESKLLMSFVSQFKLSKDEDIKRLSDCLNAAISRAEAQVNIWLIEHQARINAASHSTSNDSLVESALLLIKKMNKLQKTSLFKSLEVEPVAKPVISTEPQYYSYMPLEPYFSSKEVSNESLS